MEIGYGYVWIQISGSPSQDSARKADVILGLSNRGNFIQRIGYWVMGELRRRTGVALD